MATDELPQNKKYPIMLYINSWCNWEIAIDSQQENDLQAKGFVYHDEIGMSDDNDNGINDNVDRLSLVQLKNRLNKAGVEYGEKDTKAKLLKTYLAYLEEEAKNKPPEMPS